MNGRHFAPKEDPEHDDFAPRSDTDSEYRRIRVSEPVGRTDYADRIRKGQAIAPAAPSCADSTAPAAPSCAEFTALAAPSFQTRSAAPSFQAKKVNGPLVSSKKKSTAPSLQQEKTKGPFAI